MFFCRPVKTNCHHEIIVYDLRKEISSFMSVKHPSENRINFKPRYFSFQIFLFAMASSSVVRTLCASPAPSTATAIRIVPMDQTKSTVQQSPVRIISFCVHKEAPPEDINVYQRANCVTERTIARIRLMKKQRVVSISYHIGFKSEISG